ncbi:MAG: hypothetical protein RL018_817 [Pseudomonadota bacterium]|jgi:plasmid stabilization system protein ParE
MSRLKLSAPALQDVRRLFEFLAQYDQDRPSSDTVYVLTILHQKESYSELTVGRHV